MTAARRSPQPSHPQADRFAGVERGRARFDFAQPNGVRRMPPTAKSFHRNADTPVGERITRQDLRLLGKTVLFRIHK
jgi:hypothetical protein